jgi:DnaJ-class molecular chaperone
VEFKDYYTSLGVSKNATEKEIKQAFRRLARKYHPDVNPGDKGAEARFKEINEANEVLSDPEKRKKYDELGANWRAYEQAGPGGPFGGPGGAGGPFQGGQWSWSTGGGPGGGGFRTMTEEEMAEMFGQGGAFGGSPSGGPFGGPGGGEPGDDSPFSDFFRTFFGGMGAGQPRRGRGRPRSQKGRDVEHPIELDLEDAYRGSVHRLSLKHDGEARSVEVRIPAGVAEGSRVRVAGEGGRGTGSAPSGDLYLRVQLRPHAAYDVKGRDLHTRVRVPVTTAVLGGEVNVVTLGGKTLRLKIPETTQNGQRFRLRGHGLPALGAKDAPGDLYASIEVAMPRQLTDEERTHWRALDKHKNA